MPPNTISDIGYFRFTGTVVKIMTDGDPRCKYSDGDVEDLLLDDLVQLARLDTHSNSTEERKIPIAQKIQPDVKCRSIATAKTKRKKCNVEGCNNQVMKGGLCITHGAERKRCSFVGCTNQVGKGRVCVTHGAKVKQCSFEGCTKQARGKGGVCQRHRNNTSAIPPHLLMNYEDDEKEFNSLIWRSSQMTRVVASDRNAILALPVVSSFI